MIILGIDPGFAITGFGVLNYQGNRFSVLDYGAITTPAGMEFSSRLKKIYEDLRIIIHNYQPEALSIEELFFNKNIKTALNVAHGRGVALLAAAESNIDIFEYTPLQVKQAVTGYGRADKSQIEQMVKVILNLEKVPKPDDVSDALAVAICHGHSYKVGALK